MSKKDRERFGWIVAALIAVAAVIWFFNWLVQQWWSPLILTVPSILVFCFIGYKVKPHMQWAGILFYIAAAICALLSLVIVLNEGWPF